LLLFLTMAGSRVGRREGSRPIASAEPVGNPARGVADRP